mmetsp:Transcript_70004/g.137623  ORF Transcript_70004/g.137623 Transcript_70004/m.137623 type:complete len:326 (+) Transcript_70004:30-1007(+)
MTSMTSTDEDDDYFGINESLASKATPFVLGNWITLVSNVEGRDKLFKLVQFLARYLKWHKLQLGDVGQSEVFGNLSSSILESRKSARWLRGLNNVDQIFNEVPSAPTVTEKLLILGQSMGLGLLWHFDYLAHAHRMKFAKFDAATYSRMLHAPSYTWSAGNVCQVLFGVVTLRNAAEEIKQARSLLGRLSQQTSEEADDARPPPRQQQCDEIHCRLKTLRLKRFKGWLLVVKGFADLFTSSSMPGMELHKRFPNAVGGWMHDGTIGASGVLAAALLLFTKFPAKAQSKEAQPHQTERNTAAAIVAYMQMSTLLKAGRAASAGTVC